MEFRDNENNLVRIYNKNEYLKIYWEVCRLEGQVLEYDNIFYDGAYVYSDWSLKYIYHLFKSRIILGTIGSLVGALTIFL